MPNKYNYIHGTEAVKLTNKEIQNKETKVIEQGKIIPKKNSLTNEDRNIIRINKVNIKSRNIFLFLVFYSFIFLTANLFIQSKMDSINYTITENRDALKEKNDIINSLEVELAQSYDIQEIERRAKEELNMRKPESYQIIYIKPTSESYVNYNDIIPADSSFLNRIKDFFANIFY
ncbi:MAG: hypothetical protein ACK5LT_02070 [Lachnospirales bacterium]